MNNPTKPKTAKQPKQAKQPSKPEGSDSQTTAIYEKFVDKSKHIFDAGQEKSHEAWERAMELTQKQMAAAGEFSAEQGEAFKRYLRRDLDQTMVDMRHLGEEAKEGLNPARLGAGALSSLAKILHVASDALSKLSEKAERALEYKAGEITMAGTLTCSSCGHSIELKKTSTVPPCPSCHGKNFRKSY